MKRLLLPNEKILISFGSEQWCCGEIKSALRTKLISYYTAWMDAYLSGCILMSIDLFLSELDRCCMTSRVKCCNLVTHCDESLRN